MFLAKKFSTRESEVVMYAQMTGKVKTKSKQANKQKNQKYSVLLTL